LTTSQGPTGLVLQNAHDGDNWQDRQNKNWPIMPDQIRFVQCHDRIGERKATILHTAFALLVNIVSTKWQRLCRQLWRWAAQQCKMGRINMRIA
jgi:hypothetical protein